MIIEINKFKLVSVDDKFDLYEKVMVKTTVKGKKTGDTVEKEKIVGYNMQLEHIIRYILDRTVNDRNLTVDLCQYVKIYQNERQIITDLLK
jgi:hypothetical protein